MIKVVIFDYGGTIYNPKTNQLYPQVISIFNFLIKKGLRLALVSRAGNTSKRKAEFRRFNLNKYFEILDVVPVENSKEFTHILDKFRVKPKECLIIGDRVSSEILEGNKIGVITVWIRQGEFPNELPQIPLEKPTYAINSLKELISLVDKIT